MERQTAVQNLLSGTDDGAVRNAIMELHLSRKDTAALLQMAGLTP